MAALFATAHFYLKEKAYLNKNGRVFNQKVGSEVEP